MLTIEQIDNNAPSESRKPRETNMPDPLLVYVNKNRGYIDHSGHIVIPAIYQAATAFSEGRASVGQPDPKGKKDRITGGVRWLWGYIDPKGQPITPMCFERAREFSEGFAAVYQNGKCGYIDRKGDFLLEPQFENGFEFSEGLATVYTGKTIRAIDTLGQLSSTSQHPGWEPVGKG